MSEFVLGLAFVTVFACGLLQWRKAVWAALVLAVFEGALRKWIVPGYQVWVYFGKDGLLLGAYCGYFLRERLMRGRNPFRPHIGGRIFLILGAVCAIEAFNPRLPTIGLGLTGLQNYIFYVPLMFMVPELVPDAETARKFAVGVAAAAVIPLLLGPIQFALPPSHPLNAYAWDPSAADEIATFGGNHPRITSTFSYISGYSFYLEAMFVLTLALILLGPKGWYRRAEYVVLGLTLANLLMTGSRGPLLVLAVIIPVLVVLAASSMKKRDMKRVTLAAVMVPALIFGAVKLFPEALAAFVDRVQTTDDAHDRFLTFMNNPVAAAEVSGLIGWGTGATYQASGFLVPKGTQWDAPPPAEAEWERIVYELGPIGLALVLLGRLLVSVQLWIAYRRSDRGPRALILAGLALTIVDFTNPLTLSHTASILYYFFAGFAFLKFRPEEASAPPLGQYVSRVMLSPNWSGGRVKAL